LTEIGARTARSTRAVFCNLEVDLIVYCHQRRDVRMFAVERIRSLTATPHAFQLPLGFDIEAYVENALVVMRGRLVDGGIRASISRPPRTAPACR
jgi:hypothetical protein